MKELFTGAKPASVSTPYIKTQQKQIAPDLTIIVPVYNESGNLERVEKELSAFIETAHFKTSILFVNDGSTDNSQELIE